MKKRLIIINLVLMTVLFALFFSCKRVGLFLHESDVVAEIGSHKLYESDIRSCIPRGVSSEDSLTFVRQYANHWAKDKVFLEIAEKQLSKEQKDVTGELEEYRNALIRYRYEQEYINRRLDTNVTDSEINRYYESHTDDFRLRRPIFKVRFVRIAEDSPNADEILKKISSGKAEDILRVDSLAYRSALKYTCYGGEWVDAIVLAKEFDTDYRDLLSESKNGYIEMHDGNGNVNAAYVMQMIAVGEIAPVEYCKESIKDFILSAGKHNLLMHLEKNLMKEAVRRVEFVKK